jgi:hypothetical protein
MTSRMPLPPRRKLGIARALALAVAGVSVTFGTAATAMGVGVGASPSTTMAREALASGQLPSDPPPSSSPVPAASLPATRSATVDRQVPPNLRPTLANAPRDYPTPYLDHCHTGQDGRPSTGTCLYGDLQSRTTIALFGDSHALSWFPAVERVALREGWRLLSLTMSTCSPADIPIWNGALTRVNTACATWRAATIKRLVKERPAIILVAGTRGFASASAPGTALVGDARARAWEAGMARTLARLVPAAGKVIVVADTPLSLVDPQVCLSRNPRSVLACATPVARAINDEWLGHERDAAEQAGAGFIDPSLWVCPSSPCPVVIGNVLVYRNPGHLTATFAATLAARLGDAIATARAGSHRTQTGLAPGN